MFSTSQQWKYEPIELNKGPLITQSETYSSSYGNDSNKNWSANYDVIETHGKTKRITGWRFGIPLGATAVGLVLCINIAFAIWGYFRGSMQALIGTITEGPCSTIRNQGLYIHLAINVLGTSLLAASNYVMQCLSAPTRSEIDVAHHKGDWLDVGIPSVRNLFRIKKKRTFLWLLLALSSIPLHLLYNSVVFEVIAANEYVVGIVTSDFLTGAAFNDSREMDKQLLAGSDSNFNPAYHTFASDFPFARLQADVNNLEKLSNQDCIDAYRNPILTNRRNLLAVTTQNNSYDDGSLSSWITSQPIDTNSPEFDPIAWICAFLPKYTGKFSRGFYGIPRCNPDDALADAQNWNLTGSLIDHCLSETVEEKCQLQFSFIILVIVIGCNIGKLITMLWTLKVLKDDSIMTVGDAALSFLEHEDSSTNGLCLLTILKLDALETKAMKSRKPLSYRPKRHFWFRAASIGRWTALLLLCSITIIIAGFLLQTGINGLQQAGAESSLSAMVSMGFGAVSSASLIRFGGELYADASLLEYVLLANAPQLILSFLYLLYNGIYSAMALSAEWVSFGIKRQSLRVSNPSGEQRSTYYLQLPYRYAIPLLVASGGLHWLISQSIFLVRIRTYDYVGNEVLELSVTTAGYSCIAIICTIGLGSFMVLVCFAQGFRRLPKYGAPLASSCSLVISAACHPRGELGRVAALKPLQWGKSIDQAPGEVAHCSLSSLTVTRPIEGEVYA